jgi:hypothetical protein
VVDSQSFELTRFLSVGPDAAGAYAVVLPPGHYRVDVRPRAGDLAVTVVDMSVPVQLEPLATDFAVGPTQPTEGTVTVKDGRSLANATVEALPVSCAQPAAPTPWCMPRPLQVATGADGSFQLNLDPGEYALRVEPPPSARLPWVAGPRVTATATSAGPSGATAVPAPLSIGMQLIDPDRNPVQNALVRAFRVSPGSTVELGRALTDGAGYYTMYVAPRD